MRSGRLRLAACRLLVICVYCRLDAAATQPRQPRLPRTAVSASGCRDARLNFIYWAACEAAHDRTASGRPRVSGDRGMSEFLVKLMTLAKEWVTKLAGAILGSWKRHPQPMVESVDCGVSRSGLAARARLPASDPKPRMDMGTSVLQPCANDSMAVARQGVKCAQDGRDCAWRMVVMAREAWHRWFTWAQSRGARAVVCGQSLDEPKTVSRRAGWPRVSHRGHIMAGRMRTRARNRTRTRSNATRPACEFLRRHHWSCCARGCEGLAVGLQRLQRGWPRVRSALAWPGAPAPSGAMADAFDGLEGGRLGIEDHHVRARQHKCPSPACSSTIRFRVQDRAESVGIGAGALGRPAHFGLLAAGRCEAEVSGVNTLVSLDQQRRTGLVSSLRHRQLEHR